MTDHRKPSRALSDDGMALIEAAQRQERPPHGARERVRRALAVRVVAAAGTAAALATSGAATAAGSAGAAAGTAATAVGTGLLGKILIVGGLVGASVGAAAVVTDSARAPARVELSSARFVDSTAPSGARERAGPLSAGKRAKLPPEPGAGSEPTLADGPASASGDEAAEGASKADDVHEQGDGATSAARSPAREPRAADTDEVRPTGSDMAAEIELMRGAQQALGRGQPGRALELLGEHQVRFPNGALSEERRAVTIFALCQSGRASEARALAERFLAASPRSPLAERVRRACGSEP